MSDRDSDLGDGDEVFREVLRRWATERAPIAPDFETMRRSIMAEPSPLDAPRWSAGRSLRLAGALAWAQLRVVPWLVCPIALVTATMAALAARFFGVSQNASAAVSGFSSLMLFGVAVTITMALSVARSDTVSLATPLGPQIVVMARVLLVLTADAILGLAASGLVSAWGYAGSLPMLLAGWMVPLAVIAGAVTFVAIWTAPWASVLIGLMLVPLVTPTSNAATNVGLGALSGALWEMLTPIGVLSTGIALLAAAISSARQAATAGAQPS